MFSTPSISYTKGMKPLATIEEMLEHAREEDKWSPKQFNPRDKERFIENRAILQIDSLVDYE